MKKKLKDQIVKLFLRYKDKEVGEISSLVWQSLDKVKEVRCPKFRKYPPPPLFKHNGHELLFAVVNIQVSTSSPAPQDKPRDIT
jgi:hypothetical protein